MAASGWRGPRREAWRPAAHQAKPGPARVCPVGHAGRVGRLRAACSRPGAGAPRRSLKAHGSRRKSCRVRALTRALSPALEQEGGRWLCLPSRYLSSLVLGVRAPQVKTRVTGHSGASAQRDGAGVCCWTMTAPPESAACGDVTIEWTSEGADTDRDSHRRLPRVRDVCRRDCAGPCGERDAWSALSRLHRPGEA